MSAAVAPPPANPVQVLTKSAPAFFEISQANTFSSSAGWLRGVFLNYTKNSSIAYDLYTVYVTAVDGQVQAGRVQRAPSAKVLERMLQDHLAIKVHHADQVAVARGASLYPPSGSRRKSWALMATMMVETDITTAPAAGGSIKPMG